MYVSVCCSCCKTLLFWESPAAHITKRRCSVLQATRRLRPATRHTKNNGVHSCKLSLTSPWLPKSPGKQRDISTLINGNLSPVTAEHNAPRRAKRLLSPGRARLGLTLPVTNTPVPTRSPRCISLHAKQNLSWQVCPTQSLTPCPNLEISVFISQQKVLSLPAATA